MKCISCGKTEMVRETRDVSYTYKGQTTMIPKVSGEFCPACNESIHDKEQSEYFNGAMLDFHREVNGASVSPEFILEMRKKLKLDQRLAGEIFGGGSNAFSRYENGKTKPSLALVQLFKLLDKHPELIDELRPKESETASVSNSRSRLARKKTALV